MKYDKQRKEKVKQGVCVEGFSALTAEVVDFFFFNVFLSVSVLWVGDLPSFLPAWRKTHPSISLSLTASVSAQHTPGNLSTKGMVGPSNKPKQAT